MLIAGSDDGVYCIAGVRDADEPTAERVLHAGRAFRVRQFDALDGVFAATETGLYHSRDGRAWTDLGVPQDQVYSVAASPAGDRLYAGTRPANVYVATPPSPDTGPEEGKEAETAADDWRELDGFRDLRSREWRKDRHDEVAQVRSLCTHPDAPGRVVAGVEVGGVHVSDDGGETWDERNEGVDDDVHHVHAASAEVYVASTGFGLYRTTDVGQSWTRLDRSVDQRYFRESFSLDGAVYAGGAHGSSSSWDEETDHALFEWRDGDGLSEAEYPVPDELVIGWCGADGEVLAVTHRGTLLGKQTQDAHGGDAEEDAHGDESDSGGEGDHGDEGDDWRVVGRVPVPGEVAGRYLPLTWFEE